MIAYEPRAPKNKYTTLEKKHNIFMEKIHLDCMIKQFLDKRNVNTRFKQMHSKTVAQPAYTYLFVYFCFFHCLQKTFWEPNVLYWLPYWPFKRISWASQEAKSFVARLPKERAPASDEA